jgi:hypothetical protein
MFYLSLQAKTVARRRPSTLTPVRDGRTKSTGRRRDRDRKENRKNAPRDVEDVSWAIGTFYIYISLFYITNKVLDYICTSASHHGPLPRTPALNITTYWPPRPPSRVGKGKKGPKRHRQCLLDLGMFSFILIYSHCCISQ